MGLPRIRDHRIDAGIPSENTPFARLTISDSVVDRLVHVCFWQYQLNGKYVLGPVRTRKHPDVDLVSSLSPAKSASANNVSYSSSGLSFIFPTML